MYVSRVKECNKTYTNVLHMFLTLFLGNHPQIIKIYMSACELSAIKFIHFNILYFYFVAEVSGVSQVGLMVYILVRADTGHDLATWEVLMPLNASRPL